MFGTKKPLSLVSLTSCTLNSGTALWSPRRVYHDYGLLAAVASFAVHGEVVQNGHAVFDLLRISPTTIGQQDGNGGFRNPTF